MRSENVFVYFDTFREKKWTTEVHPVLVMVQEHVQMQSKVEEKITKN